MTKRTYWDCQIHWAQCSTGGAYALRTQLSRVRSCNLAIDWTPPLRENTISKISFLPKFINRSARPIETQTRQKQVGSSDSVTVVSPLSGIRWATLIGVRYRYRRRYRRWRRCSDKWFFYSQGSPRKTNTIPTPCSQKNDFFLVCF